MLCPDSLILSLQRIQITKTWHYYWKIYSWISWIWPFRIGFLTWDNLTTSWGTFQSTIHLLELQMTGNWNLLMGRIPCSTRDKTMSLMTWTRDVTLSKCCMIMRWLVILGKLKLWCQSKDYIGGWDFGPLSRIMWRGVVFANNTRLTNHLPIPLIYQSLKLWLPGLLHIAPWTWSQICCYPMASTLFWSW